jgi:hypothetical protein
MAILQLMIVLSSAPARTAWVGAKKHCGKRHATGRPPAHASISAGPINATAHAELRGHGKTFD